VIVVASVPVIDWLQGMLSHDFVRHAFVGGTGIALAAGLVGYLMVLRNQVFTGDAMSHVAFTGALAAIAAGVEPLLGLFGTTVVAAVGMGLLGGTARGRDVVVGTVFAWVLGLGVLFLSIYTTSRSSANGLVGVTMLFGSIYGMSVRQAMIAALIGVGVAVVLLVVARPLLFASIDADVAASRGVPVRLLGLVFLALVGVTVAEAVQAVGALLSLGLMVTPAAAVQRVCTRPLIAFGLSAACAVLCLWLGLTLSYVWQRVPPSFMVVALAFAVYMCAVAARPALRAVRRVVGQPASQRVATLYDA
jgi:zinc/manganese transport system permease protein